MSDWYLEEIEAKEWYEKYPRQRRSKLHIQIKQNLEYAFGGAMEATLAEFRKTNTTCQSQEDNLKTITERFVDSVREVKADEVVRHAVWNKPMADFPPRSAVAVQLEDFLTNELRLLPLVEANMPVNVRSGAGVNHQRIDGLQAGDQVCVIADTVVESQHTWLRVQAPLNSSVRVDGWVFDGLSHGQPTLIVVDPQSPNCVDDEPMDGSN